MIDQADQLVTSSSPSTLVRVSELPLNQHPAAVYLARLGSARSQRTMRTALNVVAQLLGVPATFDDQGHEVTYLRCDWASLRYQHTAALRSLLMQRYEPATANVKIAALRGVLEEAWRLGHMTAEAYQRAADIKTVRATPLLRGRALSADELQALLTGCRDDPSAFGLRDAAIIAVMYSTTMRRSEVAALQLRDYNTRERSLKVVKGKGRKDRLVYLEDGAFAALEAWLDARGRGAGPIFCHVKERGRKDKDGQVHKTYAVKPEKGLTDQAIYNLLVKRREQAGVDHFTPHDVRRTSISDLLDAGVDVVTVSHISGHVSTDMVKRYDRRGEKAKQQAVQRLRVPISRTAGERHEADSS
jgi:site-specific recombinase XerD